MAEGLKYFFYYITASGVPTNGVLLTTKEYFCLDFVINVAFKGHVNPVIHWWSELSRQQIADYVGTSKLLELENAVIQQSPVGTSAPKTAILRLIKNKLGDMV